MQLDRTIWAFLIALSLPISATACSEHASRAESSARSTEASGLEPDQQSEDSALMDLVEPALARRGHGTNSPHGPNGGTGGPVARPVDAKSDVSVGLGKEDVASLLWMREEEQLAHDVYVALGEHWNLRIFANVAMSERRHVNSIVRLLDEFRVPDPMTDRPSGSFTIPAMQQLYDEYVAEGRGSLLDALAVGVLIEEMDIVDLRARASDVEDVGRVYAWLEQGSRRHLRAFVRQLEARGVEAEPTQLDAGTFAEIVSAR